MTALKSETHSVLKSGNTPDGRAVSLVSVDEGTETGVVVLVVGKTIKHVWAHNDYNEALGVFQRVCNFAETT